MGLSNIFTQISREDGIYKTKEWLQNPIESNSALIQIFNAELMLSILTKLR